MKFDMTTPCNDCPFRKVGGIRISEGRTHEIASMMLSSNGGTFVCHKTSSDVSGKRLPEKDQVHCAGALIFAEKNDTATQMMRWMERIDLYDPKVLMASPAVNLIFDDLDSMVYAASEREGK